MQHHIKKQIIDIRSQSTSEVHRMQDRLSRLFWQQMLPLMEEIFDEFSDEHTLVKIERLEIDLGNFTAFESLERHFLDELKRLLIQELTKLIKSPKKNEIKVPIARNNFEQWLYFLEHGNIAWTVSTDTAHWKKDALETLALESLAVHKFRISAKKNPLVLKRLVLQHKAGYLQSMAEVFSGYLQKDLIPILKELKQVAKKIEGIKSKGEIKVWQGRSLEKQFWAKIFELLILEGSKLESQHLIFLFLSQTIALESLGQIIDLTSSKSYPKLRKSLLYLKKQNKAIHAEAIRRYKVIVEEQAAQILENEKAAISKGEIDSPKLSEQDKVNQLRTSSETEIPEDSKQDINAKVEETPTIDLTSDLGKETSNKDLSTLNSEGENITNNKVSSSDSQESGIEELQTEKSEPIQEGETSNKNLPKNRSKEERNIQKENLESIEQEAKLSKAETGKAAEETVSGISKEEGVQVTKARDVDHNAILPSAEPEAEKSSIDDAKHSSKEETILRSKQKGADEIAPKNNQSKTDQKKEETIDQTLSTETEAIDQNLTDQNFQEQPVTPDDQKKKIRTKESDQAELIKSEQLVEQQEKQVNIPEGKSSEDGEREELLAVNPKEKASKEITSKEDLEIEINEFGAQEESATTSDLSTAKKETPPEHEEINLSKKESSQIEQDLRKDAFRKESSKELEEEVNAEKVQEKAPAKKEIKAKKETEEAQDPTSKTEPVREENDEMKLSSDINQERNKANKKKIEKEEDSPPSEGKPIEALKETKEIQTDDPQSERIGKADLSSNKDEKENRSQTEKTRSDSNTPEGIKKDEKEGFETLAQTKEETIKKEITSEETKPATNLESKKDKNQNASPEKQELKDKQKEPQQAKTTTQKQVQQKRPQPFYKPPVGSEFFIQNAGIILIHPFINTYFDNLELLEDGDFKNEECQHKAIHLLHYLATRETETPEYNLILQKILCGMPINMPVDHAIEITEEEQEEGEALLQASLNYWTAMKSTTPDGLRGGFLMREGKLILKHGGWTLMVENKTQDLLIDQLPWGINIVKLPWMPEMLKVEWR